MLRRVRVLIVSVVVPQWLLSPLFGYRTWV